MRCATPPTMSVTTSREDEGASRRLVPVVVLTEGHEKNYAVHTPLGVPVAEARRETPKTNSGPEPRVVHPCSPGLRASVAAVLAGLARLL
jgi:hypothetical protein